MRSASGVAPAPASGGRTGRSPDRLSLRELPGVRLAAAATLEGQERFAAYVAHELRTPIALQRALVEVALADPEADAATLREMGERVVAGCLRQQRLIDALLDLVRSGRGPTRRVPVDLAAIAAEVLQAHDLTAIEGAVALEPAPTTGDPDLLERLAANLVSNAVRHNVAGGRVEVATRIESGRAVLSVANTGPVVPAWELQRLFQPFQRLGSPRGFHSDGLGIGLTIVQAVADAHDAVLTARARAGGGLGIDVAFPGVV